MFGHGSVPKMENSPFTPERVGALIVTIKELVDIAKRAKNRQPVLTEYAVTVG